VPEDHDFIQNLHQNGLPFDVKIPNKKTLGAIKELEEGKGERYKTMKDVWDSIDDA